MTRQAPHVVALKAAFLECFGHKLNVRQCGGALAGCLLLSVPVLTRRAEIDRAELVAVGGWLEARGYFLCQDHGRQGLLSSPAGWTCWNGGVSVQVRYCPQAAR